MIKITEEIVASIIAALSTIIAAIIGIFHIEKIQKRTIYKKLKYHSIHSRMLHYKEYIEYELCADEPGKEMLVKDFLNNMIDIYKEIFKEISYKVDNNDMSEEELYEYNIKKFHEAIQKSSEYFYKDNYNSEERIALRILVRKHHKNNRKRFEHFEETIDEIVHSKYYKNQIAMQSLIFENYMGEFSHILAWFDEVIDDINGDFKGVEFKGEKIK